MTPAPCVSVVTRTKNRIVLLKRAVESVLGQTFADWEMVVVNDGGERAPVDALLERYAAAAEGRIRAIHCERSSGMDGASAAGLRASGGAYVAIHDDDDSWAPDFLAVTVASLRHVQESFPSVRGVTTHCNRVMERVEGLLVHVDSVESFNGWVPAGMLSLDRMLAGNFLPPISFLFERAAFDALGGVYEVIPYLGDWDFMIRFLARYDVLMVPQHLAFYHWRASDDAAFGNSVSAEVERHRFYQQFLLNRWLRADLEAGRFGVGSYANLRLHLQATTDPRVAATRAPGGAGPPTSLSPSQLPAAGASAQRTEPAEAAPEADGAPRDRGGALTAWLSGLLGSRGVRGSGKDAAGVEEP